MKGVADELTGVDLERCLEIFDRVSQEEIGNGWGLDDVQGSALFRLYGQGSQGIGCLSEAAIQNVARGSTAASECGSNRASFADLG